MRGRAYVPFMEKHRLCIKLGHHNIDTRQQWWLLDVGGANQIAQLPQSPIERLGVFTRPFAEEIVQVSVSTGKRTWHTLDGDHYNVHLHNNNP